jgi:MoxR-like ATPase
MPSLPHLEGTIGLPPGNHGNVPQAAIAALEDRAKANPQILTALRDWITRQGLPQKHVHAALPSSLAKAYLAKPYLVSWRNRVNPQWALLGGADEDEIERDDAAETVTSPPKAGAEDGATQTNGAAHSIDAATLAAMIDAALAAKLAMTKLTLDDGAKAQIRALAAQAAQQRIDERSAPQTFEVRNIDTGETVNLGQQHERLPTLLRAAQARDHNGFRLNIWLTGPTGSGKTSAASAVAKALGLPFGSDGSLDADYKVLGFCDANGRIISTEFIRIYRDGGIYLADEIDNWMPSALLSLNAALANGWMTTPGGIIQRHKDCIVIAGANTWGLGATSDYVGRTRLDAASLDRFQPKISWPYDEKLELAVATSMDAKHGPRWCQIVQTARRMALTQGLKIIVSPRATFNGISLLKAGFSQGDVIDMTVAAGISPEQKKAIGLAQAHAVDDDADETVGDSIASLLSQGKRIEAIKAYRAKHGCDLYAAKTAIEDMEDAA